MDAKANSSEVIKAKFTEPCMKQHRSPYLNLATESSSNTPTGLLKALHEAESNLMYGQFHKGPALASRAAFIRKFQTCVMMSLPHNQLYFMFLRNPSVSAVNSYMFFTGEQDTTFAQPQSEVWLRDLFTHRGVEMLDFKVWPRTESKVVES